LQGITEQDVVSDIKLAYPKRPAYPIPWKRFKSHVKKARRRLSGGTLRVYGDRLATFSGKNKLKFWIKLFLKFAVSKGRALAAHRKERNSSIQKQVSLVLSSQGERTDQSLQKCQSQQS
jgi:hypothetical protein